MKALIIHKAKQNQGKTTSLKCLIQSLCSNPEFQLLYPLAKEEIIGYAIGKYNNAILGIITFGDSGWIKELQECLNNCIEENCNIIIAASRTKWSVYNLLHSFAEANGYSVFETSPIYVYSTPTIEPKTTIIDKCNQITANGIINLLNNI